jgi:hypothetical protein
MHYNGPAIKKESVAERMKAGSREAESGKCSGTSQGRAFKNCPVGNFSEGAGLRGGAKHGSVFGVMVQIFGRIRVSRYNADRKQVSYHLIVILLTALVQCRGTSLQRSQDCVMVLEFYCEHLRGVLVVRFKGHVIRKQ